MLMAPAPSERIEQNSSGVAVNKRDQRRIKPWFQFEFGAGLDTWRCMATNDFKT